MKKDATNNAEMQARAQCESIAAMVAALSVDYDLLEELREAVSDFVADSPLGGEDAKYKWRADNPEDAEELAELEEQAGECTSEEEARERIEQDALSVEVRSDWVTPGEEMTAGEFRVVLCTGGPHVEIVGDLDRGTPSRPRVLYKDWGESGELFDFDHDAVLAYCQVFYFGE